MPSGPAVVHEGIGEVSERNGVPVSESRLVRPLEGLADRVTPRQRVAAVVHLVEDDEGLRPTSVRARCSDGLLATCA